MFDLQGQGLVMPRAGDGGAPEKLLGITRSPEKVQVQNKISLCSTFPCTPGPKLPDSHVSIALE